MKIETSAIPHRYRNRFLRDVNGNYSFNGSASVSNSTTNNSGGNSNNFEPHYLWGQYFDDTEDIDGDLISNGTIQGLKGIFGDLKVNGLADLNALQAVSGYIQTLLSDEITCDYLTVTKAAHFFKLIIDEIKATQGAVIITPANAKLDKVEAINGGWRCYYRAKDDDGAQIYNCFEVNDQVVCETFDASTGVSYDVSNQYYWRLVTATGTTTTSINGESRDVHYFDLSASDCDRYSMTPKVGDNCVQLGNRTDSTRQAAIIISAYNSQFLDKGIKAPSIVQYAGINDYDLSQHRLNIISNGLNQFKGSYNNNSGVDIEQIITTTANTLDGKIETLNGTVTSHTQSISELKQTDTEIKSTVSANTTSIGTLSNKLNTVSGTVNTNSTNIATLQQTANGLTSTVASHTSSITTINNNVSNLSSSVSTNTSNISTLQQTASGLSSKVSQHTTQINSLNGTVGTIASDYVTSSELNQTATSITANITDALGNTGIDITSGKITLKADKTTLENVGSSATWLKGNVNGSCKFSLAVNSSSPVLRLGNNADSSWQNTYLSTDQIHIQTSSSNNYATLQVVDNQPKLILRRGSSYIEIYIDSSGNICIDGTFEHPSNRKKLVVDSDGYIKLKA